MIIFIILPRYPVLSIFETQDNKSAIIFYLLE
eukprot:SAG11_NODE_1984_length_3964_cov_26.503234_1_plen_32_part_00